MGYTEEQLLEYFYSFETLNLSEVEPGEDPSGQNFYLKLDPEITLDQRPQLAVHDPENGEVIVKAGQRINKRLLTKLQKAGVENIPCTFNELKERILARSVLNADGEVIARCNTPLLSLIHI